MGCAQSKRAEGGGAGVEEGRSFGYDGFRVGHEDKLPSFDSSLTARPSQHEEPTIHKPRAAAPSSALSSVNYGSLAELRKSASRGEIEPPGVVEDAGREDDELRESGGSDREVCWLRPRWVFFLV